MALMQWAAVTGNAHSGVEEPGVAGKAAHQAYMKNPRQVLQMLKPIEEIRSMRMSHGHSDADESDEANGNDEVRKAKGYATRGYCPLDAVVNFKPAQPEHEHPASEVPQDLDEDKPVRHDPDDHLPLATLMRMNRL